MIIARTEWAVTIKKKNEYIILSVLGIEELKTMSLDFFPILGFMGD